MSNFELIKLNEVGTDKVTELAKHFEALNSAVELMVTTNGNRKAILAKLQESFVIVCRDMSLQKAYQVEAE